MRALFEDVWNKGDLSRLQDIMHADCIIATAAEEPLLKGRDQYRNFVTAHLAWPGDVHITVDEQIAERNRVAMRWTSLNGQEEGRSDAGGWLGMSMHQLRDGKTVECWDTWDTFRASAPA